MLSPMHITAHGVDVVISAHKHTYTRTCAVKDRRCVGDQSGKTPAAAPVYIVDGTAGAYTGSGNQGFSCVQPKPDPANGVMAQDCMWGWSTLQANRSSLVWRHWRWLHGDLSDSLTLTK
eukprot:COSAG01_NODE_11928_length_1834_cov_1.332565_3_plen_119_part_00